VRHDNASALKAYETGLRLAPNDPLLLGRVGFVEMRLGRWDAAVSHLLQASKLDPRSGVRFANLRMAYWYLRQYREAREAAERAAALAPASADAFAARIRIALSEGNLPAARALLRRVPHEVDEAMVLTDMPTWALDTQRLRLLASASLAQFSGNSARRSLVLSRCYLQLGDSQTARIYADSARAAYEQALARSQDDPELHSEAGLAFAYLGQREAAVREGRHAVVLVPIASDAIAGPTYQARLVWIYLLVGEPKAALDQLEPLLKMPGWLSPAWLKLDPAFAPLRGNPRFERLVNGK
jgi:tetratricopeptide (TPR) repeat protein